MHPNQSKNFARSSSTKINMSKGLVNHTFAYQSILTARWMSQNCCSNGMWYSCLVRGNNVCWRPNPLAKSSMTIDARYVSFVLVSMCQSEWSSKRLERKRSRLLIICVHVWSHGSLSLSLFPSSFLFFLIYFFSLCYLYFLYISLSFFPLFFLSKPGLTPSWNKDTPLVAGTCSKTLSDFHHT